MEVVFAALRQFLVETYVVMASDLPFAIMVVKAALSLFGHLIEHIKK